LTSGNDAPERDPRDWEFQGSHDGLHWVTLDARSNETFTARHQTKAYWISLQPAYQAYRLRIIRQAGAAENNVQLSELSLWTVQTNGGLEEIRLPPNPFVDPVSLTALSDDTLAWGSGDCLWSLDPDSNAPTLLVNCREEMSAETQLLGFSHAPATGKFLLSCERDGSPLLYQFDVEDPLNPLQALPTGAGVGQAAWLGGEGQAGDGWVGQQNEVLVVQRGNQAEVPSALSWADIEALTVTRDGRQAFLLGTTSNEPAAGVWQFDLGTDMLRSVVPYADHPSPHARKLEPVDDFILSASGK
jgi:hypothetical protein